MSDNYKTKKALYNAFFGDFYEFIKGIDKNNLGKYNIKSREDFLDFCANWNADNSHSFYGVGHAFSKYFVKEDIDGRLAEQPSDSFIGYCYHNDKYKNFIPFLMKFFAYWRTDENYTNGPDDPNNTGNDFFAHPWASLVDTCKFFHFNSISLNETYPWFNSKRVKIALDNIPGVEK